MDTEMSGTNKGRIKIRNYSFKTIKAYLACLEGYFGFKKFNLEKIDEKDVKQLLLDKQNNFASISIWILLKENSDIAQQAPLY